jgi:hypothetical protein
MEQFLVFFSDFFYNNGTRNIGSMPPVGGCKQTLACLGVEKRRGKKPGEWKRKGVGKKKRFVEKKPLPLPAPCCLLLANSQALFYINHLAAEG